MDRLEEIKEHATATLDVLRVFDDRRWLLAEVERLQETLGALVHGLGLRRSDSELIADYGMLGLDIIQRARRALGKGP